MPPTPHADLTRLLNSLRIRLPGALDPTIKYELFAACDEFFCKSNAWKEDIAFGATVGETTYELEPEDTTSKIVRLIKVLDESEVQISATMKEIPALVLALEPTAAADYTATVALTVKDPVDDNDFPRFPSWLLERYREAIFDGVLGRMMSQPGKPYANERMSIYHLRRFRNAMAQATVDAQHENTHGAQGWQYPRGWR